MKVTVQMRTDRQGIRSGCPERVTRWGNADPRTRDRAKAWPLVLAIVAAGFVLAFFAIDTLRNDPRTFVAMAALAALAVILDLYWRWVRGRRAPRNNPTFQEKR